MCCQTPGPWRVPSDLGCDDEAGGIRVEGFGDQFFRDIGAVGVGSVNEVDAEFDGAAQRGECACAICRRAPDALAGDAHGAVAHAVDGQIAAEGDGSGLGGGEGLQRMVVICSSLLDFKNGDVGFPPLFTMKP